mmetsp:Transcript_10736/g.20719  ORF Transcript_10736/g.20719 Transcript_10736/m.20719 type:complete len:130 (+) Transcript_10736:227-616(+)
MISRILSMRRASLLSPLSESADFNNDTRRRDETADEVVASLNSSIGDIELNMVRSRRFAALGHVGTFISENEEEIGLQRSAIRSGVDTTKPGARASEFLERVSRDSERNIIILMDVGEMMGAKPVAKIL